LYAWNVINSPMKTMVWSSVLPAALTSSVQIAK